MAIKIAAAPASTNDSFSENSGVNATLNVRVNDGKSSNRPLYSLDNGQSADLANADPVSNAGTTLDRSALGAAIWINADGTIGYSTAPIAAAVDRLAVGETFQDSFLYATRQQNGSLLWSTVRITITGTNDAPVARADSAAVVEDSLATGSVASNDSDVDNGAVLSFAATSSAAGFSMGADGGWTLDTSHQAYQDLAAGEVRQVVVTYRVTDQHGASAASSLTLNVTGTNDAPVVAAASAVVSEGGSNVGRVVASDADRNDSLTYSLNGPVPAGLTFAADGSWSFSASDTAYQGLGAGETRELVIGFSVTDQAGASGVSTLTITVVGVNDAPIALAASASVAEDETVTGHLAATDPDKDAVLTYSLVEGAPEGFSLDANGGWSFDANQVPLQELAEGQSERILVTYRVMDEQGVSAQSTLTLDVAGRNDTPVTTSHAAEVSEGDTVSGQLTAIDQDSGARLSFAVVGDAPAGLVLGADGSWAFDASDAAYRGLAAGEIRIVEVPFSVTDEHGATAESFMVIAVTGTDGAPVLVGTPPELPAATEDSAYTVTQAQLLAGWVDPDGSPLTAFGLTAANATVTANAHDGSFTITPDANFHGVLQLSYDVTDGFRVSAASVQLSVEAVDDPAVIGGTMSGSVTEATPFGPGTPTASGQLTISDPDNNDPLFTPIDGIRSINGFGTITLSETGSWQYLLDNAHASVNALGTGQTLSDSFTVTSSDGTASSVTIVINGGVDLVRQPGWYSGTGDPNDFSAPMTGGNPSVEVWDTSGNDTLVGTDADQRFYSLYGNDVIYAQGGNDRISGLGPGGTYYGQAGDDYLQASGASTLYGGTGDDEFSGSGATDLLYGGSGIDSLRGNGGDDILVGGYHIDNLTGGAGRDTFRFLDLRDTGDHVLDFLYGTDSLDFSALDANQQLAGDQAFSWGGTTPTANGLWLHVLSDRTNLFVDTDGDPGTAEFMVAFFNSNIASITTLQQVPDGFIL